MQILIASCCYLHPHEGGFHNPLQAERLNLVQNSGGARAADVPQPHLTDWMNDAEWSPPQPVDLWTASGGREVLSAGRRPQIHRLNNSTKHP